jgi:hypothetical protein
MRGERRDELRAAAAILGLGLIDVGMTSDATEA